MAIRIRVYPQYGTRGARRRGSAERAARRELRQQQAMIRRQQQMLVRQQVQAQTTRPLGNPTSPFGYGTGLGYLAGYGSPVGFGSWMPGAYSTSTWSTADLTGGYFPGASSAFGYGTSPLLGAGLVAGAATGYGWC